ncbi:MAG: helicase [Bacilli bacterium]|nr:helicase [Bacilli bacterium]
MSISEQDWAEEEQRVVHVTQGISERIEQIEEEVGEVKQDVVNIRKHFWDDVTVNLSTPEDAADTYSSMKQQVEVLAQREHNYRHNAELLNKLTRLVKSPYFGRIDFEEEREELEQIYLGISSFQDKEGNFLVYDWRAPVSSLYYDYPPGPVVYESPGGEIRGTMHLKRQYVIHDAKISLMFDTGVTIGDELLQQALSRNADAQMRSIVATIQHEQNRIIRNDRSRMLIVQGSAGSGKTSAALQRVAYLLYKYRDTLAADQMVLFSPNPLFNSYVSTVLPELGEQNMQQTTFQDYLAHRLGKKFDLEDPFTQIEFTLTFAESEDYQARISGIRYKSSVGYMNAIHAYKDLLLQEGMIFKSIRFRGNTVVAAERIKAKFYSFDPETRLLNRIELIRDWLLQELNTFENSQLQKPWVEEEIELLDAEVYQRAYNQLRRTQKGKLATFDDFDQEKTILARMIVNKYLKTLRRQIRRLIFVDTRALYMQIFADERVYSTIAEHEQLPNYWPEICQQTLERLERWELCYEDATPYLYLQQLVQGFETNNSVRHVIVDEAQDYSPFQFEFLKRLFPRCKMTALGDLNQAIFVHGTSLADVEPIIDLYGPKQTELIRLTRSYRSTREIVEFTRGMVPEGDKIEPFNRSGEKPLVTLVSNSAELNRQISNTIEKLKAEGYLSIAVICKTASESADVYDTLKELQQVRLITKTTPAFAKETLIIPSYLAKGLEFDAVLIYNGSKEQFGRENERRLFYTACTRAMHLLCIFALGDPSPFITTQPPHTYVIE